MIEKYRIFCELPFIIAWPPGLSQFCPMWNWLGGCYEQYKTLGPGRVYLRSGIGTNTVRDS